MLHATHQDMRLPSQKDVLLLASNALAAAGGCLLFQVLDHVHFSV